MKELIAISVVVTVAVLFFCLGVLWMAFTMAPINDPATPAFDKHRPAEERVLVDRGGILIHQRKNREGINCYC